MSNTTSLASIMGKKMLTKEEYRKEKIKEYYIKKNIKNKKVKQYNAKRKDVMCKIIDNMARRICKIFKTKNIELVLTTRQLIGCTNDELRTHLEEQFTPGMYFYNYGDWEVDHITPIASFDFTKIQDQIKCFNYKNLQPLWKEDNMKKSDKIMHITK